MTEVDLIVDIHKNTDRQGPGSTEDTLRALQMLDLSSLASLKVADIGCGSGGQTLTLAKYLSADIIAIDLFPEFLEELNHRASQQNVNHKIKTIAQSMEHLPFNKEELDIIWSEGAIYNMGFEAGIKQWQTYLKPQGYLCVSEITWLTATRPQELEEYWTQAYPEIAKASDKIQILENNGYNLVGYFYLPESSWMEGYYKPLQNGFSSFLERQQHSDMANNMVKAFEDEINKYLKYKAYFSYGFYIAQKI